MTRGSKTRRVTLTVVEANQKARELLILHYHRTLRNPTVERIRRAVRCSPNAVVAVLSGAEFQRPDSKSKKRKTAKRVEIDKRRALVKKLAETRKKLGSRLVAPYMTSEAIRKALRDNGIRVSAETVRTDLLALGMKHLVRPKESLYASEENAIRARNAFANETRWNSRAVCESLIFSDETYLTVNDHSYRSMWAASKKDVVPRERKNPLNCTRVMVWAAIGIDWRSELVFFDQLDEDGKVTNMKARSYKLRCLSPNREHLSSGKLFIQDGASSHRSKEVLTYLDNHGIAYVQNWPASSPCLNMIENVWAELKRRLSDYAPTKDMEEFKANARAAWKDIPVEDMNNFCRRFPKVIAEHKAAAREAAAR